MMQLAVVCLPELMPIYPVTASHKPHERDRVLRKVPAYSVFDYFGPLFLDLPVAVERRARIKPTVTVPAGAPAWVTAELLADTIETWQPYSAATITVAGALEMLLNVGNLLDVLEGSR